MKNKTMFKVEFFNGLEGVWKGTGSKTFATLDEAKAFLQAQREMCGGCVDFHIIQSIAN